MSFDHEGSKKGNMASIKLEYIFIEKEKHDQKSLCSVIGEIIDGVVAHRDEDTLIMKDDDANVYIHYELAQKRDSSRVNLKLETMHLRVNNAILNLNIIDEALTKSEQQRYYYYIKEYDGVSKSYADRLYPKFAEYERLLRKFILNIVTEAYGGGWDKKTIQKEMEDKIKEIAKGNLTLSTTLEYTNLDMLEKYLFGEREVDYRQMLEENFWGSDFNQMSRDEICEYIQKMRPTSLWERHFSEYGDQKEWENQIKSVHEVRNKVAHHRSITTSEFVVTRKQLNNLTHNLKQTMDEIQNKQFTAYTMSDLLVNFSEFASEVSKTVSVSMRAAIETMQQSINQIAKIINSSINISGVGGALKQLGKLSLSANSSILGDDISEDQDSDIHENC